MSNSPKAKALGFIAARMLALISIVLLFTASGFAQTTTGTIRGTVTDQAGAAVAGATVVAKNQATGVATNEFKTTGEGFYVIPNLLPGKYDVTVSAAGFSSTVTTGVDVRLGQDASINVALKAGDVSASVTVTADTEEVINRDQSQISTTFETRKVEDLPSNAAGAGLDTLALLVPGVVVGATGVSNSSGTELSVNGNRVRSNNFQIDGSDNNDLSVAGPSYFVDNQDQVAEYQVITNNFSAQYGRNQGAVVNIVTKSGTNEFHGSGFEFHRNRSALDSKTNLEARDPSRGKPDKFISNVYGGTLGGPIVHDRAFFFGTYQGIKQRSTAAIQSGSLAILASEFPRLTAAFPGNAAIAAITGRSAFAITNFGTVRPRTDLGPGTPGLCVQATGSNARAIVPCGTAGSQGPFTIGGAFDVVNIGGTLFQAAFPERIFPTPYDQQEFSGRVDMKVNDRNSFYARYLFQDGNSKNALGSTNGYTGDIPFRTQNLGGSYTRQIGNTKVNEFRAVYQRLFVSFGGGCSGVGCIPSPSAIASFEPDITFGGVTGFVANRTAPLRTINGNSAAGLPQGRTNQLYQLADNLSWTRGRHSMIIGGEFKYTKQVVPFLPSFNGAFSFSSGTRLANNAPSGFSLAVGNPIITYTEMDQYYFFQDDFKIRENLTLNLGVRYEYTGQPINDLRDLTVARESGSSPLFNPAVPLESRVVPKIPADKNNFAPRFGFAWTPRMWKSIFGEDATVIRGGFSIAYDPAFYNILLNVSNAAPVSALLTLGTGQLPATNSPLPVPGTFTGDVVRQNAAATNLLPVGKLNPRLLTQVPVAPNFHSPYSEQFSFGIQRQINRNNVFEARWVRTRGVGLFQSVNRNPRIGTLVNGIGTFDIPFNNSAGFATVTFPGFPQLLPAGVTPAVCVDVAGTPDNEGACNNRLIPGRGRITSRENTAQSTYDGLQVRYNGRFLNNSLNVGAAYAFSHTFDNASEIFALFENSSTAQNPFSINKGERSRSAYDRPHVLSINFIYDFPMFKDQKGFVGHLLGGWQLNGTQVLNSGRPYTPSQFFNSSFLGAGFSYLPDTAGEPLRPFIGNPRAAANTVAISQVDAAFAFGIPADNLNGFWSLNELFNGSGNTVAVTPNDVRFILNAPGAARIFGTPFGNAPRNSLRGPAVNQLNLGLFKNTKVSERVTVQFRAEAFNVLNHPQPGFGVNAFETNVTPDIFIEDAGFTFADKTEMTLARRIIQFGLRIVF